MFKTTEDINEEIKNQLGSLCFTNFTPDTNRKIEQVFKDIGVNALPQNLILEDVQFFEHSIKIEYQVQDRHFTLILGCNK
jgi:hypothetical protein